MSGIASWPDVNGQAKTDENDPIRTIVISSAKVSFGERATSPVRPSTFGNSPLRRARTSPSRSPSCGTGLTHPAIL